MYFPRLEKQTRTTRMHVVNTSSSSIARQHHLDAEISRTCKDLIPGGLHISSGGWKLLQGILIVASAVQLFRPSKQSRVFLDEVQFGEFSSKHIQTQYFHPSGEAFDYTGRLCVWALRQL
ncbi:hypothetical protein DFH06DRAFT_1172344 [Mycena polygramma]|nr:hypothetical protein DFH06DRAFT_1172344 [Mycena polygramma]